LLKGYALFSEPLHNKKRTICIQNYYPMEKENVEELIRWLNCQISYTNEVIMESHKTNNFGRESMYEGMRDAFMRCLNKLTK